MTAPGDTHDWRYHCPLVHIRVHEQPDGHWYCEQCQRAYHSEEIVDTTTKIRNRKQRDTL